MQPSPGRDGTGRHFEMSFYLTINVQYKLSYFLFCMMFIIIVLTELKPDTQIATSQHTSGDSKSKTQLEEKSQRAMQLLGYKYLNMCFFQTRRRGRVVAATTLILTFYMRKIVIC